MIIVGCSGHAIEVLDVLIHNGLNKEIVFFDNVTNNLPKLFLDKYRIIRSFSEAEEYLHKNSNEFILGLGIPKHRKVLFEKFTSLGGRPISIISRNSLIGNKDVKLGEGLNIMHKVFISSRVSIGRGSLINTGVNIHHDCKIGEYCEIMPSATVTGDCTLNNNCVIGSGAVLTPGVTIGENAIVGAGAVVISDVAKNTTFVGVPARNAHP
jgi:sugar O-acyltransferase (sialic acid O-acetyltransferase NeuD family)